MTEPALLVETAESVATLTLNRPARLNALSDEMLVRLAEELGRVDAGVTAVVIRGAGRAFCSGHDLKHAADVGRLSAVQAREVVERMQAVAVAMRGCRSPIITLVHGYAIGGGAEIALSGDLVLVEEGAVFQFTEAAVGRVVTNGFTNLLPRTVGPVRAKELLLLGQPMSATQAKDWGLATRLCPAGGLDAELLRVVANLRDQSTWAVSAAKRLINLGLHSSFEASIGVEVGSAIEAEVGDDAESRAAAFADH